MRKLSQTCVLLSMLVAVACGPSAPPAAPAPTAAPPPTAAPKPTTPPSTAAAQPTTAPAAPTAAAAAKPTEAAKPGAPAITRENTLVIATPELFLSRDPLVGGTTTSSEINLQIYESPVAFTFAPAD